MAYRRRTSALVPEETRFREIGWEIDAAGCWNWLGVTNKSTDRNLEYGRFRTSGGRKASRLVLAHRFAYETYVGELVKGQIVRHDCDNSRCVNPAHLRTGTQGDNMQDAYLRGRRKRASPETIDAIRQRYSDGGVTHRQLAEEFGFSRAYITQIINHTRRSS